MWQQRYAEAFWLHRGEHGGQHAPEQPAASQSLHLSGRLLASRVLATERLTESQMKKLQMKIQSQAVKDDMQRRLSRVEGQVRGVQRMLEADRDCQEIVQQLNAINAAVRNATHQFMRAYARECLLRAEEMEAREAEAVVDNLLDLMAKVR